MRVSNCKQCSPCHVDLVRNALKHHVHIMHGAHKVVSGSNWLCIGQVGHAIFEEAKACHLASEEPVLVMLVAKAVAHSYSASCGKRRRHRKPRFKHSLVTNNKIISTYTVGL